MKFEHIIYEILIRTVPLEKQEKYKLILMSKSELKDLDFSNVEFGYDESSKLIVKNFSCKKHDWVKTEFTRYNRIIDGTSGCNICGNEKKVSSTKKSKEHYIKWASTKFPIYDWSNVTIHDNQYIDNGIKLSNPIFKGIVCNQHKDHPNYVTPLTPTLRNLQGNLSWNKDPEQKRGIICDLCSKDIYNKVSVERNTYTVDEWNEKLSQNEETKHLYIDINDPNPETRSEIKRFTKKNNNKISTYVRNLKCRNHNPHYTFGLDWINLGSIISGNSVCPKCQEGSASKGEQKLKTYFEENNIKFKEQERFKECYSIGEKSKKCYLLPFDFYLPELNVLVEVDGGQHFNDVSKFKTNFERRVMMDTLKNKFVEENNKFNKLIRLYYSGRNFNTLISEFERLLSLDTTDKILLSNNYPKLGWNK